jgi:hypothetical protein
MATVGLGDDLAVDHGDPLLLPDGPLLPHHLDVQLEPVAGEHRLAESGVVDGHEVGDLVVRGVDHGPLGEQGRGLGQRLQDEHAGHDRVSGKVTGEEGLVHRDALHGHQLLHRLHRHHPVHEQEGEPVREDGLDGGDVHQGLGAVAHSSSWSFFMAFSSSRTRLISWGSW